MLSIKGSKWLTDFSLLHFVFKINCHTHVHDIRYNTLLVCPWTQKHIYDQLLHLFAKLQYVVKCRWKIIHMFVCLTEQHYSSCNELSSYSGAPRDENEFLFWQHGCHAVNQAYDDHAGPSHTSGIHHSLLKRHVQIGQWAVHCDHRPRTDVSANCYNA